MKEDKEEEEEVEERRTAGSGGRGREAKVTDLLLRDRQKISRATRAFATSARTLKLANGKDRRGFVGMFKSDTLRSHVIYALTARAGRPD